ncbi:MAG: hypothetical protein ABEJ07_01655 [Candidatus Nanohaloarchaea archaeon]
MDDFELRDFAVEELEDVREETYPPQEFAGEQVHALDVDTAIEHLDRQREEYEPIRNEDGGESVKADLGSGHYLEVFNGEGGETVVRLGSETGYGADSHYDSRFRTLVQRERKSRKAAEWAVDMLEQTGDDVWSAFREQLDGRSFDRVAVDNFRDGLSFGPLERPYNFMFELKPGQDIDSDRVREYEGEMPNAEYQNEASKYHFWFTRYLSRVAEEAAYRAGTVDEEVAQAWIEGSPTAGNPA